MQDNTQKGNWISQADDQLLPGWWWDSMRIIVVTSSKLYPWGFFHTQMGHDPTQQQPHKQGPLTLIFFSCRKAFPISSVYKGLSYVAIPALLCGHSCICRSSFYWPYRCPVCVQFGQSCCRNGLGTSLELQHCLSIGLCIAAAAQGSLQGCSNSPGEQLSKLVKCFIVKPVVQLST